MTDPQGPPPGGRPRIPVGRSVIVAVILSLLLPGLGHLYIGRYGRALIWFGGAIAVGLILNQVPVLPTGAWVLVTVLAVFAAIDAWWIMRNDPVERA